MICDISKHQGTINWDALAPELDFVVIKASGLYANGADPQYARNVAEAAARGVPFHAYHFLYCTTEAEARRDAGLFYNTVKAAGHMPLFWVLDCEGAWGVKDADAPRVAYAFEAELRRLAEADIKVAIYVAHNRYKAWALDYGRYAYVWIPRYGGNDGTKAGSKPPDYPCDLWQYTSTGRLPGIGGNVDLNALTGTKPMSFFRGTGSGAQETGTASGAQTKEGETHMFTGKQLAEYCEKAYKAGWNYWYGTYGQKCGQALYEKKGKQYPAHYTSSRKAAYQKDIASGKRCADCVGLIKSFFWTGGKFDTEPGYAVNGCPDVSANGMIALCAETGPIKSIPDEPGLVVWKDGHIGVYVGGGYTVEMKGFDYDCQRNKVTAGPWTKWGRLPASMLSYDNGESGMGNGELPQEAGNTQSAEGLKKGDYGSAVEAMQRALLAWDAKCLPKYGADGEFGSETEKAVKAFQKAAGLAQTGVYDASTRKALTGEDRLPQTPAPVARYVLITGGSVNVRSAPGTSGTRVLGIVHKGDKLPWQGKSQSVGGTPWYLVEYKNQNAWVSGKYGRLED